MLACDTVESMYLCGCIIYILFINVLAAKVTQLGDEGETLLHIFQEVIPKAKGFLLCIYQLFDICHHCIVLFQAFKNFYYWS